MFVFGKGLVFGGVWAALVAATVMPVLARDIRVEGQAEVQVRPDYVVLHLGVGTWDRELRNAREENDRVVGAVREVARNWGIAEEDLALDFAHVDIQRNRELRTDVDHYTVRRTVVMTLRDVDRFEDLVMSALEAGVNYVHHVDFRTSELRKHSDQARALALQAAFEKARDLGSVGGFRVSEKPTDVYSAKMDVGTWYKVGDTNGRQAYASQVNGIQNAYIPASGGGSNWVAPNTGVGYLSVRATLDLEFEILDQE